MLHTSGTNILTGENRKIVLRGINLGNWMLIEPNMFGTAGTERKTRQAMELLAGKEKTDLFFRGLLEKWIGEDDIRYIRELGMNSVRIPLNYRYFESDLNPFVYREEGFRQLDRVLGYCRKYGLYAVLDLHAAQGCQSGDWHCNNIFQEQTEFFYDKTYEDRFVMLWKQLAERYCGDTWVAGYDLLNEPVAETEFEKHRLNEIYLRTIREIRSVDPKHLIFVEGNQWSQRFELLRDSDFGEGIVYSPHYYCDTAVQACAYPENGRAEMRADMDLRDQWIRQQGRPVWVGEFGARRLGEPEDKNRALRDYLRVFAERGESWCYWSLKDLRVRGPLYLDEASAWAEFTAGFIELKKRYCTDRSLPVSESWDLSAIFRGYQPEEFVHSRQTVQELAIRNLRETLANELTWTFAKRFAACSPAQIEAMTDSFLYQNCRHFEPWEQILREACQPKEAPDTVKV